MDILNSSSFGNLLRTLNRMSHTKMPTYIGAVLPRTALEWKLRAGLKQSLEPAEHLIPTATRSL